MTAARARDAPRADLSLLGDVAPELVGVLVVDLLDLLLAEVTAALADRAGRARALAPRLTVAVPLLSSSSLRHQKGMSSSALELKSSLPAVAAAGTNCRSPPSPPPSPRPPRNCTESAMISTAWRFEPSWASHSRQSSRPSTPTGRPLERYWGQASALLPQTVTSKLVGLSPQLPWASFWRVLTAMRSLQAAVPLGVCRSSGSRVRLPTSTTRLMFAMSSTPLANWCSLQHR